MVSYQVFMDDLCVFEILTIVCSVDHCSRIASVRRHLPIHVPLIMARVTAVYDRQCDAVCHSCHTVHT